MSHTVKLLIAIGLGGLAAVLNAMAMSQKVKPVEFATVANDVETGEVLTMDMLAPTKVPAQFADTLKKSAIPYADVFTLSGKVLTRDLVAGELILWADVPIRRAQYDLREGESVLFIDFSRNPIASVAVGENISFRIASDTASENLEWVGPFRVVSVDANRILGERVEQPREIGIAVSNVDNEASNNLQRFVDRQADGGGDQFQVRVHVN